MATDSHLIELRGEVMREDIDVIDAVVRAILSDWADRKIHEASLIQRVRRGNGNAPEVDRKRTGNGGQA